MKVRDFMAKLKDMPQDALICVAELEEAFAANISDLELVEDAEPHRKAADGREAVELAHGSEKVVVIRW